MLVLLLLMGCTTTTATNSSYHSLNLYTLPEDLGGTDSEYLQRANTLRASGRIIRITQRCDSACAIIASLPNACIAPGGSVGLHPPRSIWSINGHRLELGPSTSSIFYSQVTPQIAAAVRAMPFDYERPWSIQQRITYESATNYGLQQC